MRRRTHLKNGIVFSPSLKRLLDGDGRDGDDDDDDAAQAAATAELSGWRPINGGASVTAK